MRSIAEKLNAAQSTVNHHLEKLVKFNNLGVLVHCNLSKWYKEDRLSSLPVACHKSPFTCKNQLFLNRQEKMGYLDNIIHKRQWLDKDQRQLPDLKANIHGKKFLLFKPLVFYLEGRN